MWLFKGFCVFVTFSCHVMLTCQGSLPDVTYDVFGVSKYGVAAAFGDFNADKLTDIFVLSDSGKSSSALDCVCVCLSPPPPPPPSPRHRNTQHTHTHGHRKSFDTNANNGDVILNIC